MGQSCVPEAARSAAPRGARTGDGFGCDPLPRKQVVDAGPRAVGRVPGWVCAPKAVHQEVSAALIEREAAAPEVRRSPSRAGFLLDPNLERETGFEPATLCLGSIIPYALCYRRGNKAKFCPVICSCAALFAGCCWRRALSSDRTTSVPAAAPALAHRMSRQRRWW